MQKTVLVLGASGRLGRNAATAFERAGWEVRRFDRKTDTLWDAAWGASVIVNGWNPPYTDWADEVPGQTKQIIEVAKASGATVILPGNVYVYGAQAPERLTPDTPHLAKDPLGRIRIEMEAAYRASGVPTVVVRGGDYIDTQASGNWFDQIITKKVHSGKLTYPGPLNVMHAFSFLPDVAATMVALANRRDTLALFEDVNAPSFAVTGMELSDAISTVVGHPVTASRMAWWPLRVAGIVWPMGRALVAMSYLWRKPHFLDQSRVRALCPDVEPTSLEDALSLALNQDVDPYEAMWTSGQTIAAE